MTKINLYLAAPLFSLAELNFNTMFVDLLIRINPNYDIWIAQVFSKGLSVDEVFNLCIENLNKADVVIGILDGADADSGTCFELGYAYAKGIPFVGIRTDFRDLEDNGLNLMLSKSCNVLLRSNNFTLETLALEVSREVSSILHGLP